MPAFISQLDLAVSSFFASLSAPAIFDTAMVYASAIANSGLIWIALGAVLLCFKRTRKSGFILLFALLTSFILSEWIIKPLVMRPRPFEVLKLSSLLIDFPSGSSFPSSHSTTSFAAAVCVFMRHRSYGTAALILAALIAFSRLYLCVHFLSDIIVGIILGTAIALIACKIGGKAK